MTALAKHTPGPWVLQHLASNWHGFNGWNTYAVRSSGGNNCLAVIGEVDRFTDEWNEANARLIAAAPELLGLAGERLERHLRGDA
jgi:hypothetical protein